jgi:hypothetical protein
MKIVVQFGFLRVLRGISQRPQRLRALTWRPKRRKVGIVPMGRHAVANARGRNAQAPVFGLKVFSAAWPLTCIGFAVWPLLQVSKFKVELPKPSTGGWNAQPVREFSMRKTVSEAGRRQAFPGASGIRGHSTDRLAHSTSAETTPLRGALLAVRPLRRALDPGARPEPRDFVAATAGSADWFAPNAESSVGRDRLAVDHRLTDHRLADHFVLPIAFRPMARR